MYYIRRNTVFSFPVHMRKFKKSLAHGQVPIDFLLARSKKSLAPGVGQSDLSAPDLNFSFVQNQFKLLLHNTNTLHLEKGTSHCGKLLRSALGSVKIHLNNLVIYLIVSTNSHIYIALMGYNHDHCVKYVKPKSIYLIFYCSSTFYSTVFYYTSFIFILFLYLPSN